MSQILRAETESGRPQITFFDSGLGGSALVPPFIEGGHRKYFYDYDIVLYADHEGLPYGNKNASYILERVARAIERAAENGSDIFIIACNTASAVCFGPEGDEQNPNAPINRWRKDHPNEKISNMKIIGIIRPAALELKRDVEAAVQIGIEEAKKGKMGNKNRGIWPGQRVDVMVFATDRTVRSGAYIDAIERAFKDSQELHHQIKVCAVACPGLADRIEACHKLSVHNHNDDLLNFLNDFAKEMKGELRDKSFRALIPACTHYWFIHHLIKRSLKKNGVTVHNDVLNDANIAEYMVEDLGLDVPHLYHDPQRGKREISAYSTKPESELEEKTSALGHLFSRRHEGVLEFNDIFKGVRFKHLDLGNLTHDISPEILEAVDQAPLVRTYSAATINQPLARSRPRTHRGHLTL